MKDIGIFNILDPRTYKFYYGNWGSRPYEYQWVINQLKKIKRRNDINIVDVGIGLPEDSNFFEVYLRGGYVLTGVDPDSRLPHETIFSKKCRIVKASATDMSFISDKSVDVVVSISTVEHIPIKDLEQVVKEITRILKPGGHLLITMDMVADISHVPEWAILQKSMNPELRVTISYICGIFYHFNIPKNFKFDLPAFYGFSVSSKRENVYVGYLHLTKEYKN